MASPIGKPLLFFFHLKHYLFPKSRRVILINSTLSNRGRPGDEQADYGYTFTNTRRRSNSSSHAHDLASFKTKFETIEQEPVFEEELHGAPTDTDDDDYKLEKESTTGSMSSGSIEEEAGAKNI